MVIMIYRCYFCNHDIREVSYERFHFDDIVVSVIRIHVKFIKPMRNLTLHMTFWYLQIQSFMRGWLCRRKWKIIVQDYICSPHAESMRKRNQIVFNMLEAETEYVLQLSILVNCFLRPLRMAASSKKPPIGHDDVSSIFINRYIYM